MRNQSLFEDSRLTLDQALELTIASLKAYGERFRHWACAFSGGKDSTATVTALTHLIDLGVIPRPESLTVLYADTRLELPPLQASAKQLLQVLANRGIKTQVVMPPLDDRFLVYMFGRGVPPPKNRFRWCTSQLKVEPMLAALEEEAVARGFGYWKRVEGKQVYRGYDQDLLEINTQWRELWASEAKLKRQLDKARKEDASQLSGLQIALAEAKKSRKQYESRILPNPRKMLMITGVRLGESAARDQRIITSCSRDGAECGQGWFQESTAEHIADTLAPLLHWRVCHIADWLEFDAPGFGFPTEQVLSVYHAGEEGSPIEIAGRTGCVGCPLASNDHSLDRVLKRSQWQYLTPLRRLRPLWTELYKPHNRLRKGMETKADGSIVANPGRIGPLTMEAREMGLAEILSIQTEINQAARLQHRPEISLINSEELSRIRELIANNTWPNRWDGTEQRADAYLDRVLRDGSIQPVLAWDR
ncbi:MAG TPA: hypothetical protein VJ302_04960 [Blastocatellia bacterium]|nr:hypothetical protein [Blastocatellia bacterium]